MRTIDEALEQLKDSLQITKGHGSNRALAQALGVTDSAIVNWRKRGIQWQTLNKSLSPEQFRVFSEWFHGGEAPPPQQPVVFKSKRTRGDDLLLAQKTVLELLGDGPGFSESVRAELIGMAIDELRELRAEGREEQFRRRLTRLVDYTKSIATQNISQVKPQNVPNDRAAGAPSEKRKP